MRIILFPIEEISMRYSAQWMTWFQREFKNHGVEYIMIHPNPLSAEIRDGSFLDVCGTNYYKARQIAVFCDLAYTKQINNDDVIFLMDAWLPGLESIAYIRDGLGLKFKIVGCLHAGTYDPYDFLTKKGMGYWGKSLEESWFRIIDKIFVATEFHKRMLIHSRDVDPNKIKVTGWPIYHERETRSFEQKENIVVFPHRLNEEKNPQMFDLLKNILKEIGINFCTKNLHLNSDKIGSNYKNSLNGKKKRASIRKSRSHKYLLQLMNDDEDDKKCTLSNFTKNQNLNMTSVINSIKI